GLLQLGLEITVVEAAPRLMPQQLDDAGAGLLRRQFEALGVRVITGVAASALTGEGAVTGVKLPDGTVLDADLVVISCGVRANVDEARTAGLDVGRAIVVDDQLRTSDEHIYALGECAEHRGKVPGLVDPVYEQARLLADVLTEKDPNVSYAGSRVATTLKVL